MALKLKTTSSAKTGVPSENFALGFKIKPMYDLSAGITEKDISSRQTPTFGSARSTLDSLRSSNDSFSFSAGDLKADKADEPKLNSLSAQANAPQTPKAEKKENLAYPFGGWTDEDNYR